MKPHTRLVLKHDRQQTLSTLIGGRDDRSLLNPGVAIFGAVFRDLRAGRHVVNAQPLGGAGDDDSGQGGIGYGVSHHGGSSPLLVGI
jgi:hypothetical protein